MGSKVYFYLAAIIFLNIASISWIHYLVLPRQITQPATNLSGLDDDGSTWPTKQLPVIAMPIENSLRYELNSTGDLEWAALFPNDGTAYLGPRRKPYTISMFHQLRCLDLLRKHIMGLDWPKNGHNVTLAREKHGLTQHCLKYLRHMIVCRADTALEAVAGKYAATREGVARCKDWRVIYDALQHNRSE